MTPGTPGIPGSQLERQLTELTRWPDAAPDVWKAALETHEARQRVPILKREIRWSSLSGRWAAVLVVALTGFAVVLLIIFQASRSRSADFARRMTSPNEVSAPPVSTSPPPPSLDISSSLSTGSSVEATYNDRQIQYFIDTSGAGSAPARGGISGGQAGPVAGGGGSPRAATTPPLAPLLDRQVVRTSTIELTCEDIRAAFLKASLLISEATGEFIEQSTLTGEGPAARASLTLRIAATRLSTVLNELRELGEVEAESTRGEDVTAQIVDLDARLTNERRVEQELLQLLESRNDAPLEDILALRRQINDIRLGIERLTAQRERLGRLVSLATVLVIISPPDAEEPEKEEPEDEPIGEYFKGSLGTAWLGGLRLLVDTGAFLLHALIGGLVWWIALAAALVFLRQYVRRRVQLGLV